MSTPIGHRVTGVVPLLAGREWAVAARDLQEFLERMLHSLEGMPSDVVMSQISAAVQDDLEPVVNAANTLTYALLLFDADC